MSNMDHYEHLNLASFRDLETPDDLADPEGVTERAKAEKTEKSEAPSYVLDEFEWGKAASGREYMRVKRPVVESAILEAQALLDLREMLDADPGQINSTLEAAKLLVDELTGLGGEWAASSFLRWLGGEAASNAVRAVRYKSKVEGYLNKTDDDEVAEWAENLTTYFWDASQKAAAYRYIVEQFPNGGSYINVKSAAWRVLGWEAYKASQRYLPPGGAERRLAASRDALRMALNLQAPAK